MSTICRGSDRRRAATLVSAAMVDFSFAVRILGGRAGEIAVLPPVVHAVLATRRSAYGRESYAAIADVDIHSALFSALRTLAAIGIFTALVYSIDRPVIKEVFACCVNSCCGKRLPP